MLAMYMCWNARKSDAPSGMCIYTQDGKGQATLNTARPGTPHGQCNASHESAFKVGEMQSGTSRVTCPSVNNICTVQ